MLKTQASKTIQGTIVAYKNPSHSWDQWTPTEMGLCYWTIGGYTVSCHLVSFPMSPPSPKQDKTSCYRCRAHLLGYQGGPGKWRTSSNTKSGASSAPSKYLKHAAIVREDPSKSNGKHATSSCCTILYLLQNTWMISWGQPSNHSTAYSRQTTHTHQSSDSYFIIHHPISERLKSKKLEWSARLAEILPQADVSVEECDRSRHLRDVSDFFCLALGTPGEVRVYVYYIFILYILYYI